MIADLKKHTNENLHVSHGMILGQLYKEDGIIMSDLAKKINRNKSTTTTLVKKLAETGFIEIKKIDDDDRVKLLYLTESGKSFEKTFKNFSKELTETTFKGVSEEEIAELNRILCKISNNFD